MIKKRLLIILGLLMIISIVNNYNAIFLMNSFSNYYIKQLIWYLVSFIFIFILSKVNINWLFKNSFYLYLFGIILLIFVLLFGTSINGARGWIRFGFVSLQPSEFMKIFLILYLRYFTLKYDNISSFKYILFSFIIVLIPSILTFLEPDTGAVIIYLIIYLVFLFLKKFNKYFYIFLIGGIGLLLLLFMIIFYKNQDLFISIFGTSFFYRMDRITNFVKKEGFQINTALTNIANAGFNGTKKINYFPEGATDFAFTLFISFFGYLGLIIFMIIYYLFFYYLNKCCNDKYLLKPIFYLLLFQYCINILMNIGFMPIIGIPLPFLSYGGSSLLSNMILIGLLINKKSIKDTYL